MALIVYRKQVDDKRSQQASRVLTFTELHKLTEKPIDAWRTVWQLMRRDGSGAWWAMAGALFVGSGEDEDRPSGVRVLLGPMAESTIASIHTQTLFLAVAGVHGGGADMIFGDAAVLVMGLLPRTNDDLGRANKRSHLIDDGLFDLCSGHSAD